MPFFLQRKVGNEKTYAASVFATGTTVAATGCAGTAAAGAAETGATLFFDFVFFEGQKIASAIPPVISIVNPKKLKAVTYS